MGAMTGSAPLTAAGGDKARDGPHPGAGYACSIELLYGLLRGEPLEDGRDLLLQGLAVLHPARVVVEELVACHLRPPEHGLAESLPFPLVLYAEEDTLPIPAHKGSVGGYGGVASPA